jgi:5-methylcytosine-specific restriction endonuclease McrA
MDNVNVLKLDSSFKPVEVISWQEAVVLTWLNKAWAAEYTDKWVHSAKKAFQIPSVIVLFRYIDEKFFQVPCVRRNILLRDDFHCQYCGNRFKEQDLTIDHVHPRSKGGKNDWDNVATACRDCNQKKGDHMPDNAPVKIIRKPTAKWKEYL